MANVAQILCDVISPEADARSTHVHLFATLKHSTNRRTDRRTDGPPDRYTEIPLHTQYASNSGVYFRLNAYWTCSCFV